MTLYRLVWCELALSWAVWCCVPIFRAPHNQKRPSITARGPTLLGLLFEISAYCVAVSFRQPAAAIFWPRLLATAISAPFGVAVMWTAVAHLGRQFRINAGLYADHELVSSGPYGVVRHPIYASMLLMLVATAALVTRWKWGVAAIGTVPHRHGNSCAHGRPPAGLAFRGPVHRLPAPGSRLPSVRPLMWPPAGCVYWSS